MLWGAVCNTLLSRLLSAQRRLDLNPHSWHTIAGNTAAAASNSSFTKTVVTCCAQGCHTNTSIVTTCCVSRTCAISGKRVAKTHQTSTRAAYIAHSSLSCRLEPPVSAVSMATQPAQNLHSAAACRAYVGEATPAAGEYHCNDFDWEDLRQEAEALLAERKTQQQNGSGLAMGRQPALQPHDPTYNLKIMSLRQDTTQAKQQQQQQQQLVDKSNWQYEKGCWEAFHARDNATARFYKERRYLLLEFPYLTISQPPQRFLEIGCGCGSSLLPLLKANPTCTVTGTDLSPTAVDMFKRAAAQAGIAPHRFTGHAADSTQAAAAAAAAAADAAMSQGAVAGGAGADAVLLIFTLAAVAPEDMPAMLHTAFQALRPGGLLLTRDHGLYDLTHLRLPPEQQLAEKLYRRLDGTTCYFFTTEDLQAKAEAAGFATIECKYACTSLLNRKKQITMKRVFVHGVFQKPLSSHSQH